MGELNLFARKILPFVFFFCFLTDVVIDASIVPETGSRNWLRYCEVREHIMDISITQKVTCFIPWSYQIDYRDIRPWADQQTNQNIAIDIKCQNGGSVIMPWPFKMKNLISLEVEGCRITRFFSETANQAIIIDDELRLLRIENSVIEVDADEMFQIIHNYGKMTRAGECGQETVEIFIFRNIKYEFLLSPNGGPSGVIDHMLKSTDTNAPANSLSSSHHCHYKALRYIDESQSDSKSSLHWRMMTHNADFDVVRYYNLSSNALLTIPIILREWWRTFPTLETLDLSHNNIQSFSFNVPILPLSTSTNKPIVINLRHNAIRKIPRKIASTLRFSRQIVTDLRDNPLHCDCDIAEFRAYLSYMLEIYPNVSPVVNNIKCQTPPTLAGRNILDPTLNFFKSC